MQVPKFPDCASAIEALERKGLVQTKIKAETGISQGGISNLKLKRRDSVSFEKGLRLFTLYADVVLGKKLVLVNKSRTKN